MSTNDIEADPCSYSNVTELRTNALHLDLVMDFASKKLTGTAKLSLGTLLGTLL